MTILKLSNLWNFYAAAMDGSAVQQESSKLCNLCFDFVLFILLLLPILSIYSVPTYN